MRTVELTLNPGKMEPLWIGSSGVWETGQLPVLDGVALPLKELLWIWDPCFSLEAQVASMARSAFCQLWLVCQLHLFLDKDSLNMVIMHW